MTGVIEARQRNVESGLVIVFAAYRRHQAAGDLVGMGSDLLNLALFFGDVHRYRAQRSCVNRAIRCFERAGATFSQQKARKELHRLDQMQAVRMFDSTRN